MKEYLRAVCLCMATMVAVLFATGVVWYGYLVTAALFGLTRGETGTAIPGIALVAGAVKAYRERRRQRARKGEQVQEHPDHTGDAIRGRSSLRQPEGGPPV